MIAIPVDTGHLEVARHKRLRALLQLIRPLNVAITFIAVIIGGMISSRAWIGSCGALIIAACSAGLIAAGGNAYNDYCDRDLDGIQKPHRPIPAGKLTPLSALNSARICLAVGWVLAFKLNAGAVVIASLAVLFLILYSRYWKKQPLIGNIAVAVVAALAFVYGGTAVDAVGAALWAAWLALLFHLGREIIKDLEDAPGDALAQANTLVVRYGKNRGKTAAILTLLILIGSLLLPYRPGPYRSGYAIAVLVGVFPVIIIAIADTWRATEPAQFRRISVLLKVDMLVGLAALFIGRPLGG